MIDLSDGDAADVEDFSDGASGKAGEVLDAVEPFFRHGRDQFAIFEKHRAGVRMEDVQAENIRRFGHGSNLTRGEPEARSKSEQGTVGDRAARPCFALRARSHSYRRNPIFSD